MTKPKRQLILNKGGERFIFRFDSGHEDKLLDALVEQVKDDRTNFDWFDAAVLSFKLTQQLIGQADELLHTNPDPQPIPNEVLLTESSEKEDTNIKKNTGF